MSGEKAAAAARAIKPIVLVFLLVRVPLIVVTILFLLFLDLFVDDVARESARYVVADHAEQLSIIAVALALACCALRYTSEAMISLVAPGLRQISGWRGATVILLPRLLAAAPGIAVAIPLLRLAFDEGGVRAPESTLAAGASLLFVLIGLAAMVLPRFEEDATRPEVPSPVLRLVAAFAPLVLLIVLSGGLFGTLLQPFFGNLNPALLTATSTLLLVAAAVGLFLTCLGLRFSIDAMTRLLAPELESSNGVGSLAAYWLPRAAAALLGLWVAVLFLKEAHLGGAPNVKLAFAGAALLIGVFAGALGANKAFNPTEERSYLRRSSARYVEATGQLSARSHEERAILAGLLVAALVISAFFFDVTAVSRAQLVGPIAVVLLWATAATALFFPLAYFASAVRLPLLAGLVALGTAFSIFDLNDNHALSGARSYEPGEWAAQSQSEKDVLDHATGPRQRQDLLKLLTQTRPLRFGRWLASRKDLADYDHYPVFLIATEGGGIRAAFFTAYTLAALQDLCPAFAQHVFAISSVSGGSIGAAMFAALAAEKATNERDEEGCNIVGTAGNANRDRVRKAFERDLFSPLLSAMLFPDALQRILPVRIPEFDRARGLEHALEVTWATTLPNKETQNRMVLPIGTLRMALPIGTLDPLTDEGNKTAVPNLFLNVTDVASGEMQAISTAVVRPLPANPDTPDWLLDRFLDWFGIPKGRGRFLGREMHPTMGEQFYTADVPLSAAAVLSARFPYVTPAARVDYTQYGVALSKNGVDLSKQYTRTSRVQRFVDGGYFEVSGSYMAKLLVTQIMEEKVRAQADELATRPIKENVVRSLVSPEASGAPAKGLSSEPTRSEKSYVRDAGIFVISINSTPNPSLFSNESKEGGSARQGGGARINLADGLNEILSPARALRNTSAMRAFVSQNDLGDLARIVQEVCGNDRRDVAAAKNDLAATACRGDGRGYAEADEYPLSGLPLGYRVRDGYQVPLTWLLSNSSISLIREQVDFAVSKKYWATKWSMSPFSEWERLSKITRLLEFFKFASTVPALKSNANQIRKKISELPESLSAKESIVGSFRPIVCVLYMRRGFKVGPGHQCYMTPHGAAQRPVSTEPVPATTTHSQPPLPRRIPSAPVNPEPEPCCVDDPGPE